MKKILSLVFFTLFFIPLYLSAVNLPTELGPYDIGYTKLKILDTARQWNNTGNPYPLWVELVYPRKKSPSGPKMRYSVFPLDESIDLEDLNAQFSTPITDYLNFKSPNKAVANGAPLTEEGPFPLVILSQGDVQSGVVDSPELVERLASHGFVVANVLNTHLLLGNALTLGFNPFTNSVEWFFGCPLEPEQQVDPFIGCEYNFQGGIDEGETLRFQDVNFAVNSLQAKDQTPSDPFSGLIDFNKIGFLGMGSGTNTGISLTTGIDYGGNPIGPSPSIGIDALMLVEILGYTKYISPNPSDLTIPALIVGGSNYFEATGGTPAQFQDIGVGINSANEAFNAYTSSNRYKVTIPNSDHLAFFDFCEGLEAYAKISGLEDPYIEIIDPAWLDNLFANSAARQALQLNIFQDGPAGLATVGAPVFCDDIGYKENKFAYREGPENNNPRDVIDVETTYAVSFFSRWLKGDTNYDQFLTPQWAADNEPLVETVEIGQPQ